MTLFEALFLGHLVGDFLFQTRWMADNKKRKILPRLVHSMVYTLAVYVFSWLAGGIRPLAAAIILISHFIIDQRSFTSWWTKTINRTTDVPWLNIVIDQVFHLLVLAAVVYL